MFSNSGNLACHFSRSVLILGVVSGSGSFTGLAFAFTFTFWLFIVPTFTFACWAWLNCCCKFSVKFFAASVKSVMLRSVSLKGTRSVLSTLYLIVVGYTILELDTGIYFPGLSNTWRRKYMSLNGDPTVVISMRP